MPARPRVRGHLPVVAAGAQAFRQPGDAVDIGLRSAADPAAAAARQLLRPAAAPEQRQVPAAFGLRQRNATQYLAEWDTNP